MSKRSREKQARRERPVATGSAREEKRATVSEAPWLSYGLPLLLAAITFCVYGPSLRSDFVYDGRQEILEEGFITSLSNLPAVFSLKVLSMPLILADRPGTMLYLMLNAAFWGTSPWGYHLASNLLHAANVGLLFVLLRRLVFADAPAMARVDGTKIRVAMGVAVLVFALHPMAVEPVSAINYSSDLLVAFFTLLTLLAATAFRPSAGGNARLMSALGVLCCLSAVMSKESGAAAALLLAVYWFLFRRGEAKAPWFWFIGAALAVTLIFLAARFSLALPGGKPPLYLGNSFSQVFWIQPRLWVFMLGKLLWPVRLSADYMLPDADMVSTPLAFIGLIALIFIQGWLAMKSRIGALGMALFWLGLATVSNFLPLYRINADRFYYLPLAGVSLQLTALLLTVVKARANFWLAAAPLFIALIPLTWLTVQRQQVFASDLSLWRATTQVSPYSWTAHMVLGVTLQHMNQLDEARAEFEKAIQIDPGVPETHNLLAVLDTDEGKVAEAIAECEIAVHLNPRFDEGYNDLGNAYLRENRPDLAIPQYQTALQLDSRLAPAAYNLGNAFLRSGKPDLAMAQYQNALEINPDLAIAHANMGTILWREGQLDAAIEQYEKAVKIAPDDIAVKRDLNAALAEKQKQQDMTNRLRSVFSQHH